jgi:hypothetical protein
VSCCSCTWIIEGLLDTPQVDWFSWNPSDWLSEMWSGKWVHCYRWHRSDRSFVTLCDVTVTLVSFVAGCFYMSTMGTHRSPWPCT